MTLKRPVKFPERILTFMKLGKKYAKDEILNVATEKRNELTHAYPVICRRLQKFRRSHQFFTKIVLDDVDFVPVKSFCRWKTRILKFFLPSQQFFLVLSVILLQCDIFLLPSWRECSLVQRPTLPLKATNGIHRMLEYWPRRMVTDDWCDDWREESRRLEEEALAAQVPSLAAGVAVC